MKVTLLGGVGEVGGNKVLVEEGSTRILLDFGLSFTTFSQYFDEYLCPRPLLSDLLKLGVLPPLPGIYREDLVHPHGLEEALEEDPSLRELWRDPWESMGEKKGAVRKVDAVVLTHAHLDHAGAIPYLDPSIPILGSPVTLTFLRVLQEVSGGRWDSELATARIRSLRRQGNRSTFPGSWVMEAEKEVSRPFVPLKEEEETSLGSLRVTLLPVDHSPPGSCAVLVRGSRGKTLLYTGDLRFHGRLEERTQRLRKICRGLQPDLLICEGTRISEERGDSEEGVEKQATEAFTSAQGRLALVEFGWKDTTRFETLARAAQKAGRTLLVPPKLSYLLFRLHEEHGSEFRRVEEYGNVRVFLGRKRSNLYSKSDYITEKHEIGYAVQWEGREGEWTPSQAERYLAHYKNGVRAPDVRKRPEEFVLSLSFYDMNDLLDLDPPEGSVHLTCTCEPYNDEMVVTEEKKKSWLRKFRINEGRDDPILRAHASGHASGPDLKEFLHGVEPRRILPIHTTHPEAFEGLGAEVVPWEGEWTTVEI